MSHQILMPSLSAGMEEGTIARWLKAVGETLTQGEVIAEIETDKATMEYEAAQSGVLAGILAGEGETVAVNAVIALLEVEGEAPAQSPAGTAQASATAVPAAPLAAPTAPIAARDRSRLSSPLARRIARDRGMSLDELTGSGPAGRIVRVDVQRALDAGSSAPAAPEMPVERAEPPARPAMPAIDPGTRYTELPLTGVRKVIARRLTEAKSTIPHFYLEADCVIDALLELRASLNAHSRDGGKISVNDLVVKAAALALREVPEANVAWTSEALLQFEDADISVAVATDGGLITPIVRQADRKGLSAISSEVKSLAVRARDGKLQPEEYQGGSFTVSNLGMYGVKAFSAIINPPQSCILAVGAAERRPVVREEQCVPATIMSCTLSVDHRSVDGAVGARYLAAFKALIEQPMLLML